MWTRLKRLLVLIIIIDIVTVCKLHNCVLVFVNGWCLVSASFKNFVFTTTDCMPERSDDVNYPDPRRERTLPALDQPLLLVLLLLLVVIKRHWCGVGLHHHIIGWRAVKFSDVAAKAALGTWRVGTVRTTMLEVALDVHAVFLFRRSWLHNRTHYTGIFCRNTTI